MLELFESLPGFKAFQVFLELGEPTPLLAQHLVLGPTLALPSFLHHYFCMRTASRHVFLVSWQNQDALANQIALRTRFIHKVLFGYSVFSI